MKITKEQISRWGDKQTLELDNGLRAVIEIERDDDQGPPWKEQDGHGPVSDWRRKDCAGYYAKKPGERLLHEDDRGWAARFYDWQEAMNIARRDGWGLTDEAKTELALGKPVGTLTRGEICAAAVGRDFERLRGWCKGDWQWVFVSVSLQDADGEEIDRDALGGVESDGDYWREIASAMVNTLLDSFEVEQTERAAWEARDVMTEGARP